MTTKRNILLWVSYDFANSVVSIVYFLYFSQWIVVERGISDILFNLSFTVSAILLLFTVPVLGFLLDKFFRRITGIRYTTSATAILYGACAVSAIFGQDIIALVFFTLGLYFFLLSFTFYTPLINDIALPGKRGRISGFGIMANYLGQLAGLFLVLPLANGSFSIFGSSPRAETLLPAVIVFFVLALPMLIFFKEPKREKIALKFNIEIRELLTKTKELFRVPGIALFILAYFLFNDAIMTASNNFSIFLEQVWGVPDVVKTYILLGILITSAIGGLVSGMIADRFGHKKTLLFILAGWVLILPLVGLIRNFTFFVVVTTVMGFWFGANWAVSRSVMSYLAPNNGHNLAFAYFGLVERASAFVGPIVWGLVIFGLAEMGSDKYRFAVLAVTIFIILGLVVLARVKSDRPRSSQFGTG